MRKIFIILPVFLVLLFAGCSKDDETVTVDNVQKEVLSRVFGGGFNLMIDNSGVSAVKAMKSKALNAASIRKAKNETITFNDKTIEDELGIGTVTVNGTMTFTNSSETTGSFNLVMKEVFKDYSFLYDTKTYKTNGQVSCISKMTYTSSGSNYSVSMYSIITGTLTITGPSYNQTLTVNLTSTYDTSKGVYKVTGTLNGGKVDYNYSGE